MSATPRRSFVILWLSAMLPCGCAATPATDARSNPPASELSELSWMAGAWVEIRAPLRCEEYWTSPAGGSMLGMNRTLDGDELRSFEFLRIENRADGIYYLASPEGRSVATPFQLVYSQRGQAVFENPANDYPQRIVYWGNGRELHARIEGQLNGQPTIDEWSWTRVPWR